MLSPEHSPATPTPVHTVPDLLNELAKTRARLAINESNENVIDRERTYNRLSEIANDLWATIGELDPTVEQF